MGTTVWKTTAEVALAFYWRATQTRVCLFPTQFCCTPQSPSTWPYGRRCMSWPLRQSLRPTRWTGQSRALQTRASWATLAPLSVSRGLYGCKNCVFRYKRRGVFEKNRTSGARRRGAKLPRAIWVGPHAWGRNYGPYYGSLYRDTILYE